MRRALRRISTLLIAVLLTTVLTPSFGWEASAGPDAHEKQSAGLDSFTGFRAINAGEPDSNNSENVAHQDGCAIHMLGHLVADLCAVAVFTSPEPDASRVAGPTAAIPTGLQERLYRPPLALPLA